MRGTPLLGESVPMIDRIIPADAGNTVCQQEDPEMAVDHPRGCGEHT